jgi:imidazolonepropionase-like amidohydrolase
VTGGGDASAGAVGGPGLVLRAAKVLTCDLDGPGWIDRGAVRIRDGRIEAVGRSSEIEVPDGWELVDVGEHWLAPGLIDLHCHVAGNSLFRVNDLNDMVYLTNPGVRASASVIPGVDTLREGVAGGVTTVLYIPGSGTNIGGQGVLVKPGLEEFERMLVRNPGSLKLAQAGNPERFSFGVGRAFMNWNTRDTFRRGLAYAAEWAQREERGEEQPVRDPQWDIFHHLLARTAQVSTHTQVYQVVLMTLSMIRGELGLDVYLDHSTIGAWRLGAIAEEMGVPAIVGPRSVDTRITWSGTANEGIRGVAAGYQGLGHTRIGFNTDSPIVPQAELSLQAAMACRYGFDDTELGTLRGLTIVPALAAGIADRVGSLEVGKDADVLVVDGHPADPRTTVHLVLVEGEAVYDPSRDGRRW